MDSPVEATRSKRRAAADSAASPSLAEATRTWARIGLLSFGGPAAQIALMHRILVDEKKWLSEALYLNALSFCMLLPGPEAMQLATYAGWRLHGTRGGLAAGLLFVLPGACVVLALSMIYAAFGRLPLVEALFFGIKAAVLVIVVEALLRISRRALKGPTHWADRGPRLSRHLLPGPALSADRPGRGAVRIHPPRCNVERQRGATGPRPRLAARTLRVVAALARHLVCAADPARRRSSAASTC